MKPSFKECFFEVKNNIHTANVIGEDDEYYYVVPIKATSKVKKDELSFELKPLMKKNLLKKLRRGNKVSKYKYRELREEIMIELIDEHPELFI